jgi:outer membrane receptor protein involved in Fe transport
VGHADDGGGTRLANSPTVISKARVGAPLWTGGPFLAGSLQYISARNSWTGARLGGAVLADFSLTTRLHPRFDLEAGVHNAFNRRYEDPIYLAVDRMRGDGRSFYVRLVCHVWQ